MADRNRPAILSADAERDIDEIWDYLASHASMDVADKTIHAIARACERLENRPFVGRSRDDVIPGMRSTLATPYIVFYRVTSQSVMVVRVLHQRRDIDAIFSDELDH